MLKGYIKAWDIAIIAAVLATAIVIAAFCLLVPTGESESFYIKHDGEITEYPLAEDTVVDVVSNGISLRVECKNRAVRVISADCPDRLCEKNGEIKLTGESVVCLPAKLIIGINSGERSTYEADGIVG
ncbi:MAG: NusG domain II-containing protein [Clostridia bacterium]|nr:NusG domain II-containing protein [Clostridia bacterium]